MKVLTKKLKFLAFCFGGLLLVFSMIVWFSTNKVGRRITIGTKNDTEQHLLGEILAQLIEKKSNLKVRRMANLEGTTICFHAILSGTVDVTFEYTGTAFLHILKKPLIKGDLYPIVKEEYEKRYGLIWLDPLGFSNHYVLIARSDSGMEKISDIGPDQKIVYDPEFSVREEAILLKKAYPVLCPSMLMDQVLLYFSLLNRAADVISGWTTSGQLADPRFRVLVDDLQVLPRYEVAPVVRKEVLERFPELKEILKSLKDSISKEEICHMNHAVEFLGQDVNQVAADFVSKKF